MASQMERERISLFFSLPSPPHFSFSSKQPKKMDVIDLSMSKKKPPRFSSPNPKISRCRNRLRDEDAPVWTIKVHGQFVFFSILFFFSQESRCWILQIIAFFPLDKNWFFLRFCKREEIPQRWSTNQTHNFSRKKIISYSFSFASPFCLIGFLLIWESICLSATTKTK